MIHETLRIEWSTSTWRIARWLERYNARYGALALNDPLWRWGVFPANGAYCFAFESGDILCWDGTRVWLHSSGRQEVETCEAKEDHMLKFGTGTITHVASDSEEGHNVRTAVALSEAEREGIIAEGEEETEGE